MDSHSTLIAHVTVVNKPVIVVVDLSTKNHRYFKDLTGFLLFLHILLLELLLLFLRLREIEMKKISPNDFLIGLVVIFISFLFG